MYGYGTVPVLYYRVVIAWCSTQAKSSQIKLSQVRPQVFSFRGQLGSFGNEFPTFPETPLLNLRDPGIGSPGVFLTVPGTVFLNA